MTTSFAVEGMTCAGCAARVEAALRPLAEAVTVTLDPPRARLTGPRAVTLAEAAGAVAGAGRYRLREEAGAPAPPAATPAPGLAAYRPLIVIVGVLALACLAGAATAGGIDWHLVMVRFMAGFLIVFGAFKLLDPAGFAEAYAAYDLAAARWRGWGAIYPYLQLALGFALLFGLWTGPVVAVAAGLSAFGGLGVLRALRRGGAVRCACLGTALNLPMSTVTLVEDFGMAAMGAAMLLA